MHLFHVNHLLPCRKKMELLSSLFLCLSLSSLLLIQQAHTTTTTTATTGSSLPGTIERTSKQQIITSIPPSGSPESSFPFITSPAGKYTGYFIRRMTAPGAGGFGNDFCYVQVQEASTQQSVWESECSPVSSENACSLVFSENGLEVFDGSNSVWNAGAESADSNFLETLELVDQGDMRIRDKSGELAWKASDDPRANQGCGLPGSPGLGTALPPFAAPVGGNLPFGQQQQPAGGVGGGGQPNTAVNDQEAAPAETTGGIQAFGSSTSAGGQPLVDNSPYDSGSSGGGELPWIGMALALLFAIWMAG